MENFNYVEHYNADAEHFDYFEDSSKVNEHDERRVHEYIISKIPIDVKNILDVGCGNAWAAEHFIHKKKIITSLDVSIVNPRKALRKFPSPFHSALTGDSFHLPVKDNSFDCVIASEIIEHIINPRAFVKELYRVVKPEGRLIITTPYKEVLKYFLCIHCNQKTPLHAHIHSFDEDKLKALNPSNDNFKFQWTTFGNKLLLFLRTYVILKHFPFQLWKIKDKAANFFFNKPAHIIAVYKK